MNNMSVYFGKKAILEDRVFNSKPEFTVADSDVIITS